MATATTRKVGESGELRPTIIWCCKDSAFLLRVLRHLPGTVRCRAYDDLLEGIADRTLTRSHLFVCQGEEEQRVERLRVALQQTRQLYGRAPTLVLLDPPDAHTNPEHLAEAAVQVLQGHAPQG